MMQRMFAKADIGTHQAVVISNWTVCVTAIVTTRIERRCQAAFYVAHEVETIQGRHRDSLILRRINTLSSALVAHRSTYVRFRFAPAPPSPG